MPRKSVKKIMKELMAKKNLTTKEKKLLAKMKKGGGFFDFAWLFGSKTSPVDQATLTKQYEDLKGQICKVCKAAYGEEGCKCGNTAPAVEEPSTTSNVPATPMSEVGNSERPSGEGDISSQELSNPAIEPQPETQPEKKGGKRKSNKLKNKRSKRASRKNK